MVNWELSLKGRLRFGPVLTALFPFLSAWFRTRAALQLEILALRHQIGVLQRSVKRPKLTAADRFFWAWISSAWNGWESRVSISGQIIGEPQPAVGARRSRIGMGFVPAVPVWPPVPKKPSWF